MNKSKVAAVIMGVFAGLGGASHGPGEILQGKVRPGGLIIQAWPQLTTLQGEPAMTILPSFAITGILAIIFGLSVAVWSGKCLERKYGGLMMILLSIMMLLFGAGLIPPFIGIASGLIGMWIDHKTENKHGNDAYANQVTKGGVFYD